MAEAVQFSIFLCGKSSSFSIFHHDNRRLAICACYTTWRVKIKHKNIMIFFCISLPLLHRIFCVKLAA